MEEHFGKLPVLIIARRDIFAVKVAILLIAERLCHLMSNHLGEVVLVTRRLIEGGRQRIPNGWRFLKLGDMLGKGEQKVAIPLRNGLNLKRLTIIAVQFVASERNLPKTISFHCQQVAQIISQTFNHYAVIAIAKSGSTRQGYFNIYENPELLGD